MIAWAFDTGTSRNASALARVELVRLEWRAWTWIWQGSQGSPLSIENTVGPCGRRLWDVLGRGKVAADGWYAPELRRGFKEETAAERIRIQGGELKDVYGPTRRLVQRETQYTLHVQAIGWAWTGSGWREDARSGERVVAGIKAVESESRGGKLVVSLPEEGSSHHDEAVAVMRALWHAGAGDAPRPPRSYVGHPIEGRLPGSSLADRLSAR